MLCVCLPTPSPIIKWLFSICSQSPVAQDLNFGNLPGLGCPLDWTVQSCPQRHCTPASGMQIPFCTCSIISTGYQSPITIDIDGVDRMQLITLHEIKYNPGLYEPASLTGKKGECSVYLIDYCQLSCTMLHRFSMLPHCEMEGRGTITSLTHPFLHIGITQCQWRSFWENQHDREHGLVNHAIAIEMKAFQENRGLASIDNGNVIKTDTVITAKLQVSVCAAVVPLEDIPNCLKNWHTPACFCPCKVIARFLKRHDHFG